MNFAINLPSIGCTGSCNHSEPAHDASARFANCRSPFAGIRFFVRCNGHELDLLSFRRVDTAIEKLKIISYVLKIYNL